MLFNMSEPDIEELYKKLSVKYQERNKRLSEKSGGVGTKGDYSLAKGQVMGPLATKLNDYNSSTQTTYYGISIPSDVKVNESADNLRVCTDKAEALKIVKKYKKARFKAFESKRDALEFSVYGCKVKEVSSPVSEISEPTSPVVGEKPSPFKGPKAQDLVGLRKMIECGDIATFRTTIWDNPRYLVSNGDTPAILQEGSRYNALHVAAKAKNAEIADLILRTVSDVAFVQLLYGDDVASCRDRADILVDLYLNTPDKALNETPLHFAVKFGAISVVETLLLYPQCDKCVRNKFGQTPKDVICSRVSSPDAALRHELATLLDDRFYVPVLRSEDNSMQPTVGEPFSPACPLVLKATPITPRMEIRAYAGPMGQEEATVFRKKWKTPPRMLRTPLRNSNTFTGSPSAMDVRLQDTEKGLERVGRDLAVEFKVGWHEYWPFLDAFVNLASRDGLQKLEAYLRKCYHDALVQPLHEEEQETKSFCSTVQSSGDGAISPMSDLCLAFKACSLSDNDHRNLIAQNKVTRPVKPLSDRCGGDMREEEALLSIVPNPGLSPFLYVEKSCQVFAKRIADGLCVIGRGARCGEPVSDMLRAEVRHLQDLICSFKDDARFLAVDLNLVHSRIASLVAAKLRSLVSDEELDCIVSGLKSAGQTSFSDDEDMNMSYRSVQTHADRQRKSDGERLQVHCLAELMLSALETRCSADVRITTEEECMRVWADARECVCLRQNFVRNSRKAASFKRSHHARYVPSKMADNCLDGVTRRLMFEADPEDSSLKQQWVSGDEDSADEEFLTPPSSPEHSSRCLTLDSDEDMETPDEGASVYINGDAPSKLDVAVLQAIESTTISHFEFPNICRWRHSVLLHSEQERASWMSPSSRQRDASRTPERLRSLQACTPPQPWHKITGPYSPHSFNS